MPLILLLTLILGSVIYWIIHRSVPKAMPIPKWVLWLLLMLPILVFTLWMLIAQTLPPPLLIYGLMFACSMVLYSALAISSDRLKKSQKDEGKKDRSKQTIDQTPATAAVNKATAKKKKVADKPITREEETLLERCFPWSTYYLQKIDYLPQAMICKGKLKTSPGEAYQTVQQNIERSFGDRFLVLLQEGLNGKPFFALVPNPQAKNWEKNLPASITSAQIARIKRINQAKLTRPGLAVFLALATLLTTTFVGSVQVNGAQTIAERLESEPTLLLAGLGYSLSLMAILGLHETGHYLATRYHKVRATLPYFIPLPFFLGTLGAFIKMRSPMPNRRALFDIGITGPLIGFIVSLPILIWGLAQSTLVPLGEEASLFNVEALDPGRSTLLLLLSRLAIGSTLTAESAINLHPVAISGCLGLIVTALKLMPVGQLDGGHVVHAMYGQRTATIVSHVARVLMVILAYANQEFLIWALLLLFIPAAEPALNDVSELNGPRDLLGLLSLALLVVIILPAPAALSRLLF
ncbi:MAG: site-2 protease family protein [Cyanobacteria bacterium J06631_9]